MRISISDKALYHGSCTVSYGLASIEVILVDSIGDVLDCRREGIGLRCLVEYRLFEDGEGIF